MSKSYYYYSQTREVTGPVSEETLKELHKVGAVGDNPQICEKGTKTWLKFADVFPELAPASKPATSPSASSGPPALSKNPVAASPTPAAQAKSATVQRPQQSASGTGKNSNLKPILIGCGALALLAMMGGVGLMGMFAAAGSDAAGGGGTPSNSAPPPPPQAAPTMIGRPVTAMNRGVGGGARIRGVVEQESGDRCKVTITWISEYATGDLAPYGYGHVFQGDSVWTPKRIWSPDY